MDDAVGWNIGVSKDTDLSEEAVRAQVFHQTVQEIKARNADTDPDELQAIIDNAVQEVRIEARLRPAK